MKKGTEKSSSKRVERSSSKRKLKEALAIKGGERCSSERAERSPAERWAGRGPILLKEAQDWVKSYGPQLISLCWTKLGIDHVNTDWEEVLLVLRNATTKEFVQQKALEWKLLELSFLQKKACRSWAYRLWEKEDQTSRRGGGQWVGAGAMKAAAAELYAGVWTRTHSSCWHWCSVFFWTFQLLYQLFSAPESSKISLTMLKVCLKVVLCLNSKLENNICY